MNDAPSSKKAAQQNIKTYPEAYKEKFTRTWSHDYQPVRKGRENNGFTDDATGKVLVKKLPCDGSLATVI